MVLPIVGLLATFVAAYLVGRLVTRVKLPSILGWLITGMVMGPHALGLMSQELLDNVIYQDAMHILECGVGLMIGGELVWSKLKKSGRAIIITTLTQSLGTYCMVALVFGIAFYLTGTPIYLAFIFGGIALATAPAPALSIVREFKTKGPVTSTLIPMAALDDIVGCVMFFGTMTVVSSNLSAGEIPGYLSVLTVTLPLVLGAAVGFVAGKFLKKPNGRRNTLLILIGLILVCALLGFVANALLPQPVLNFMLIGMAFSATFANMVGPGRLDEIMDSFNPILGVSMILVILNLGAPLDYHLILGAGLFTAIYILARAAGKYLGAFVGAAATHSPKTIRNYLGVTLLPHSGVSLVFTGIAVSTLSGPAPECVPILQGTIAAAAVINEIIAVILAKKGFEWAGEMNKG